MKTALSSFSVLAALALLLALLPAAGATITAQEMPPAYQAGAGPQAVTWTIECVDCPKLFDSMTDRSLRLDAVGRPHIAYG